MVAVVVAVLVLAVVVMEVVGVSVVVVVVVVVVVGEVMMEMEEAPRSVRVLLVFLCEMENCGNLRRLYCCL